MVQYTVEFSAWGTAMATQLRRTEEAPLYQVVPDWEHLPEDLRRASWPDIGFGGPAGSLPCLVVLARVSNPSSRHLIRAGHANGGAVVWAQHGPPAAARVPALTEHVRAWRRLPSMRTYRMWARSSWRGAGGVPSLAAPYPCGAANGAGPRLWMMLGWHCAAARRRAQSGGRAGSTSPLTGSLASR